MDPANVPATVEVRIALPVPVTIAIEVLGEGCEPPMLGKRTPQGVGDGTVRKSVGEFL